MGNNRKLYIETYGCQMNVADSEVVASVMSTVGYDPSPSLDEADAVLLNTCSIRDNAEQKILSRLAFLNSLRRKRAKTGNGLIIGVIGCMAERVRESSSAIMALISWPVLTRISTCPIFSHQSKPARRL